MLCTPDRVAFGCAGAIIYPRAAQRPVRREIIKAAHGDYHTRREKTYQIHIKPFLDERQEVMYNNIATLAEYSAVYGGSLNTFTVCRPWGGGAPCGCSHFIISLVVILT